MGYSTNFYGEIAITPTLLTHEQITFIESMFGDIRDWNPEDAARLGLTWFDFEFNSDHTALQWNGSEKSYDMAEKMEYIILKTIEKWPDLRFNGVLDAYGEESDDRWRLIVKDNDVNREELVVSEAEVTCPHCANKFTLN